jgi:hypothetical protein
MKRKRKMKPIPPEMRERWIAELERKIAAQGRGDPA